MHTNTTHKSGRNGLTIREARRTLAGMGWHVAGKAGGVFDLVALGNGHQAEPTDPSRKASRPGWLAVQVRENGFTREELRAVARDRGGRVVFAVRSAEGVGFEA